MLLRFFIITSLILIDASAFAGQRNYMNMSLGVAFENNDNILQTSEATKKSDNILHSLLKVEYNRKSPLIDAYFSFYADRQDYLKNLLPDQTVITSTLGLKTTIVKNRYFWNIENIFNRVKTNSSGLDLPSNQENIEHFSTGPELIFFQTDKQALKSVIKFHKLFAQKSDINSNGYGANIDYIRNLSRTLSVDVSANYSNVKYDNPTLNTDYSRIDTAVDFSKRLRLSILKVGLGNTKIIYGNNKDKTHSIFRASLEHQLGSKLKINLGYSRKLGDFTGMYTSNNSIILFTTPSVNSNIFIQEDGNFSIIKTVGNYKTSFIYTHSSFEYDDVALNVSSDTSEINFENKLSSTTSFNINTSYTDSVLYGVRNDLVRKYGAGITKSFNDVYDIAFYVQHIDQTSNYSVYGYTAMRYTIGGHYYF